MKIKTRNIVIGILIILILFFILNYYVEFIDFKTLFIAGDEMVKPSLSSPSSVGIRMR